jgi:hypothetical protein
MMMGRFSALIGLVVLLALVSAVAASAHVPTPDGNEGCTPGFWKNNLIAWESTSPNVYSPNTTLESVFNVPDSLGLDNTTFLEALNFQGNIGPEGRLLRQAVAALLGTVHFDVAYPIGDEAVLIAMVNNALSGQTSVEGLKDQLDRWNNLGCPLSANIDY